ncbi:MAG: Ig-like domain-containing protein, partial [Clostridia bacterium]|nr:Ig-like domain-containing protein [Clostridia bacterium]
KGGSKVGGLIGYCDVYNGNRGYIKVEYCYAKGVITKGDSKGGITSGINSYDRNTVRYCYFNNVNNYNNIGFGVSLLDFTSQNTFYDWNFDTVWEINSDVNNGYPYINYRGEEEIVIDGEGTEESPYIVTNEKQLCYIASEKLPLSAHYKLANDVVITANFWTPIGCDGSNGFSGVFDGNGYSITGAHTENIFYQYIGLFGKSSGTIKNLNVEAWFKGNNYVGGLIGYNNGTVENCSSYIDDPEYYIYGTDKVGGLIGYDEYGIIIGSSSSATVSAAGCIAGGLIGFLRGSNVKYCYSTSDVTGADAGGLVGWAQNNSYDYNTMISNCYAMGKITGTSRSGGLIGFCDVYSTNRGYLTVEYCYARGLVVVDGATGGLVGDFNTADRNVIRYCYYNIANTGNAIGFGVKAATLKQQETLYGWDFDNIWKIEKGVNSGYPYLDIRGETPVNILQGNGEEDRPYLIYTEQDLRSLVADTYGPYDLSIKHFYKLMNDIEVTANFWTPIGANGSNTFNGIFDGNGHTISGIQLSNSHYAHTGLFGKNSGTIKNLTVEANIVGKTVGAICGENSGTIENCSSRGSISNSSENTERYCGGLVGINTGTITLSNSSVTVTCPGWEAGGLAGRSNNGTITYSYATGAVSGRYAGGLAGRVYNTDSSVTSLVSNCYAGGDVSGTEYAGGLIGFSDVYSGNRGYISIEYSYATGKVDGGNSNGGLVGYHNTRDRNFIRYSYYNSANTGNKVGFSATLGQMADRALYYMWDFDNIWDISSDTNNGYPYLNVTGKTKTHYLDGYGDEDDPYMIETEEDLWALVLGTYDLTSKFCYQLQNDIEITAEHWTPIGGNGKKVFNGIFDGNGYTISGLKLSDSEFAYQGLFANNSGTIKNLNVVGNISGREYVGLLCAYNTGIIDNCSSAGTAATVVNATEIYTGGLVGINMDGGAISNSHSTATVTGYNWEAGGLVGRNQNSTISCSYAAGDVTARYAGGLVGRNHGRSSDVITTIENCYATGDVTASTNAGGLVGLSSTHNGYNYPTAINNSYSLGKVSNTEDATYDASCGGLVGYSTNAVYNSILSSYYNQTNTGLSDIDRGTPLSDSAMKLQSSYVGWDYTNVWSIAADTNNGYPTLKGAALSESVPVTGITLNCSTLTVGVGNSAVLTATVMPDNATNPELSWVSSSDKIATVNNGTVVGKSVGTALITVTTADGGFAATCEVSVTAVDTTVAVTGITVDKSTMALNVGESGTLTATVTPADATNASVSWTTSNSTVAFVSNGVVSAKAAGTAIITAATADGGFSAQCTVTVTEKQVDENAPVVTVSTSKATAGSTVTITVDLANNTGFASLGIEIGYDASVMTLTNVANNTSVGGIFTTAQSYAANPYNMGWDNVSNITYNGTLVTLTFTIGEDAADGVYPVTVDFYKGVNGNYTDGYDVNYDDQFGALNLGYTNGSIEISSYTPGDVSGDGVVNNRDVTYLLRYLAGWDIEDIVEAAMDTDGSGTVNNRDVTNLLRYLAGWDIELK